MKSILEWFILPLVVCSLENFIMLILSAFPWCFPPSPEDVEGGGSSRGSEEGGRARVWGREDEDLEGRV